MSNISDNTSIHLNQLGLNPNEQLIYLALLRIGKGSIIEISKESNVTRTTVYGCITDLLKLGLIVRSQENGKSIFVAVQPQKLVDIQKMRVTEAKSVASSLEKIFLKDKAQSDITQYEYEQGLHESHIQSLDGNIHLVTKFIGDVGTPRYGYRDKIDNYIEQRKERGIRNRVVTNKSVLDHTDYCSWRKIRRAYVR